jgi:hypothetical protein
MIELATAHATSTAPPAAFFERWADTDTWPAWNADTEWVRLDGPFAEGATGTLKPRGGPKVGFVVEELVPDKVFTDVSSLTGARMTFAHRVDGHAGTTTVDVDVTLTGPLARLWVWVIGRGIRRTLQADLDRLVTAAEAAGVPR